MKRILLLHPSDNCAVALDNIRRGDALGETGLEALDDIPLGHKVALTSLSIGEKILKYGAAIGSITRPTPAGSHIHLHNLKSDYIAMHCRTDERKDA